MIATSKDKKLKSLHMQWKFQLGKSRYEMHISYCIGDKIGLCIIQLEN